MAITLGADDKKKLYMLGGLLGLLGIGGVIFVLKPFGGSSETATANSALTTNSDANSARPVERPAAVSLPPGRRGANFGNTGAPTAQLVSSSGANAGLTPQIPGIGRTRKDPFVPFTVEALPPPPAPTPLPPTRTTVIEQVPVSLSPFSPPSSGTGANLPDNSFPSGSNVASTTLYLPPATVFGNVRRDAPQPLPTVGGLTVGEPGAQTEATNAYGKRVAGVILGDSIRALIEYQENGQTVSKVVQPGDEVGGMKILSIQRLRSGDQSIVRVTARENGQDVFFDLGPGS